MLFSWTAVVAIICQCAAVYFAVFSMRRNKNTLFFAICLFFVSLGIYCLASGSASNVALQVVLLLLLWFLAALAGYMNGRTSHQGQVQQGQEQSQEQGLRKRRQTAAGAGFVDLGIQDQLTKSKVFRDKAKRNP